jgi:hypothetical protein
MDDELKEKIASLRFQVGETREFEFAGGVKIAGAICRVLPTEGEVKIAFLRDAVALDSNGKQLYRTYELPIIMDRLADVG